MKQNVVSEELTKFECDGCGKLFSEENLTFIACEGLFCERCNSRIENQQQQDAESE